MDAYVALTVPTILVRLLSAGIIGALIGYERRMHHKSIGIAGMMLVALGSATYMLLAQHLTASDPSAVGRLLQGFFSGIGFLGGAVIFKGGTDVRGIKTAAAIWITGAIGLAIGTSFYWLGLIVGLATAIILFIADMFPGTRQQIEEHADQVERRVEQAEQRADHVEQQAKR
ncbi:MAG TPA: MgtC/SapB family protein [Gammaproteobacteria bacterium]|nr:MgtC/SapB family protein [Gammaproteobacteria bacterium]